MDLLIAVTMSVLVVASFVIGTISVMATHNMIYIVVWFAGVVSACMNVYYGLKALDKK